jgi:hypothetical protein
LLAAPILGGLGPPAGAWIYPEHRDIAGLAVQRVDPHRRAEFDRLWQSARFGDERQLCATGADAEQGTTPSCIEHAWSPAMALRAASPVGSTTKTCRCCTGRSLAQTSATSRSRRQRCMLGVQSLVSLLAVCKWPTMKPVDETYVETARVPSHHRRGY